MQHLSFPSYLDTWHHHHHHRNTWALYIQPKSIYNFGVEEMNMTCRSNEIIQIRLLMRNKWKGITYYYRGMLKYTQHSDSTNSFHLFVFISSTRVPVRPFFVWLLFFFYYTLFFCRLFLSNVMLWWCWPSLHNYYKFTYFRSRDKAHLYLWCLCDRLKDIHSYFWKDIILIRKSVI